MLEEKESDPDALSELFRLDYLDTRIRRNAESLLDAPHGDAAGPAARRYLVRIGPYGRRQLGCQRGMPSADRASRCPRWSPLDSPWSAMDRLNTAQSPHAAGQPGPRTAPAAGWQRERRRRGCLSPHNTVSQDDAQRAQDAPGQPSRPAWLIWVQGSGAAAESGIGNPGPSWRSLW